MGLGFRALWSDSGTDKAGRGGGCSANWFQSLRLPRDHYIRLDSNDYSVHPCAVGRRVQVTADLERTRVCCEGRLVADHARVWAKHQTISDTEHLQAGAMPT